VLGVKARRVRQAQPEAPPWRSPPGVPEAPAKPDGTQQPVLRVPRDGPVKLDALRVPALPAAQEERVQPDPQPRRDPRVRQDRRVRPDPRLRPDPQVRTDPRVRQEAQPRRVPPEARAAMVKPDARPGPGQRARLDPQVKRARPH